MIGGGDQSAGDETMAHHFSSPSRRTCIGARLKKNRFAPRVFWTKAFWAATALAVVSSGSPAAAQEVGNAARGRTSASLYCADCHRTEPGAGPSPLPAAPPFAAVAKTKGMTALALLVWLRTSHPSMPNIILMPETADDIIAYILSLRSAGVLPAPVLTLDPDQSSAGEP